MNVQFVIEQLELAIIGAKGAIDALKNGDSSSCLQICDEVKELLQTVEDEHDGALLDYAEADSYDY